MGHRTQLRVVQPISKAHYPIRTQARYPLRVYLPRLLAHLHASAGEAVLKGTLTGPQVGEGATMNDAYHPLKTYAHRAWDQKLASSRHRPGGRVSNFRYELPSIYAASSRRSDLGPKNP